jgi:hypothetical protein
VVHDRGPRGVHVDFVARAPLLKLPQTGLFHERIQSRHGTDLQSHQTVQESQANDVRVQETEREVQQQLGQARAAPFPMPLLCLVGRVPLESLEELVIRPIAVMEQPILESTDSARTDSTSA